VVLINLSTRTILLLPLKKRWWASHTKFIGISLWKKHFENLGIRMYVCMLYMYICMYEGVSHNAVPARRPTINLGINWRIILNEILRMLEFRFSQRRLWRVMPSGMWRQIVW
jgi:hypothetical protein